MKISPLFYTASILALGASRVYTGFNYGAFWSEQQNVKKLEDFRDGFNMAKNLSASVPFDSARIYTCKTQGTVNEPTGAFAAAVETKTNLFLGFWITPGKRGDPIDGIIKDEMAALEKAFNKYGQALADLVIGLSVGNEDIYRWYDTKEVGVSQADVSQAIKQVKAAIASSTIAPFMKGKPIGHVDTAKWAVVDGADFYGMTAYPYWNNDTIETAKDSFHGSLEKLKQQAGNVPIWIAELGWPFEGPQRGASIANADNMQRYWKEVGCSTMGLYNTFWFELIKDSEINQPDWGLLDAKTHKPRIKDLSCPAGANVSTTSTFQIFSSHVQDTQTWSSVTLPTPTSPTNMSSSSQWPSQASGPATTSISITIKTKKPQSPQTFVTFVTVTESLTKTVYAQPSSAPTPPLAQTSALPILAQNTTTPAPISTNQPSSADWCVTVADIARNGEYVPVYGQPPGPDGKCSPPPTYTGYPYVTDGGKTGFTSVVQATPTPVMPVPASVVAPSPGVIAPVQSSSSTAPVVPQISAPPSATPIPPAAPISGTQEVAPSSKHPFCKRKLQNRDIATLGLSKAIKSHSKLAKLLRIGEQKVGSGGGKKRLSGA